MSISKKTVNQMPDFELKEPQRVWGFRVWRSKEFVSRCVQAVSSAGPVRSSESITHQALPTEEREFCLD
jgi:hypothetical protein